MATANFTECGNRGLFVIETETEWDYPDTVENYKMMEILTERTIIVEFKERQRGDILVIYKGGKWLHHTAVYLGNKKFFHKRGMNTSEITDIKGIVRIYGKDKIEYRRVK